MMLTTLVLAYSCHGFDVRQTVPPSVRTLTRARRLSLTVGDVALIAGADCVVYRNGHPDNAATEQLRLTLSPHRSVVDDGEGVGFFQHRKEQA